MAECNNTCTDVVMLKHFPKWQLDPDNIKMVMISECCPQDVRDYFDGEASPKFLENTNTLFKIVGRNYKTINDYLENGIYLTTALKCPKKEYLVSAKTIENCSRLLEDELNQFKIF